MKKLFFLLMVGTSAIAYSQVGINTTSPQGALDVVSNTGAFIPPRMTTAQRNAIVLPPSGAVIYNTTTSSLEFNYGIPASPTWKTPVTSTVASSNIVLAGGSSSSAGPTNASADDGVGYYEFTFTLPSAAKCKLDLYPTGWSNKVTGVGTDLYIDNLITSVASVVTTNTSPQNMHVVVPYSYVTPSNLASGDHTVRVKASSISKIDGSDRITYSYLCWN
ncbi:hypothetical protein [Chryseobacterium lathyri]|uniref:hypothetical protein n=1 Tax=Chryseobacterium lathyri TaxID=395933 RepID=UPI00278AD0B4|nr:hypothetical protein [Chryseobacterium lathyri]MDQ0065537.1 hypothetical protein [Chryseobacterium lathyri]